MPPTDTTAAPDSTITLPMSEAEFIELAGAPKDDDQTGGEPGRPMKAAEGTRVAKDDDSGEKPAKKRRKKVEAKETTEDPDAETDEDPDDDSGSDETAEDSDDEDEETDSVDDAEDDSGSDDEDEEETPATTPKKIEAKKPEPKKDEDTRTDAEKAADAEAFQSALDLTLDDVPAAARPLVERKIKDLERGWNRIVREVRTDQTAALTFRAEERFRRENPVEFLVSMLLEKPELAEQFNQRIEEMEGNQTAVKGHAALVEKARSEARKAEETERQAADEGRQRVERAIASGRAAAKAAGVPFDMGVEDAIAAHMAVHGQIDDATITAIAKAKADVLQNRLRQERRDRSGKYVAAKVQDRKQAGLRVKPGAGVSPGVGSKRMPKNDEEFAEQFAARMGG